jgi:hypothetical protein
MFIVILLRAHSQHDRSGIARDAYSGAVDADDAIFDFAALRLVRKQRMRFQRHACLFPTAECAAALRLLAPLDHVRADRPALAADDRRLPIEIDRAGTLHDCFNRARLIRRVAWLGRSLLTPADHLQLDGIARRVHFRLLQLRRHVRDQRIERSVFLFGLDLRHRAETDHPEKALPEILRSRLQRG